jgi:hypothetical protein
VRYGVCSTTTRSGVDGKAPDAGRCVALLPNARSSHDAVGAPPASTRQRLLVRSRSLVGAQGSVVATVDARAITRQPRPRGSHRAARLDAPAILCAAHEKGPRPATCVHASLSPISASQPVCRRASSRKSRSSGAICAPMARSSRARSRSVRARRPAPRSRPDNRFTTSRSATSQRSTTRLAFSAPTVPASPLRGRTHRKIKFTSRIVSALA